MCSAHANESTENIDEIVQDHDTFGTDENEEDSMDSLTMALMESRQQSSASASSTIAASTSNSSASSSHSMLNAAANKIGGYKRKSGEEILEHGSKDYHNHHQHHHQNQIGFDPMRDNEISPLNGPFKRKREAFSDQEQEVCLTPVFVSPESSMLLPSDVLSSENQKSPLSNVVPSVESISSVPQVRK